MFSFFRSKNKSTPIAAPATPPSKRMELDERKAFRQEMLYQSIRESFLSMEVIASMYKFKVMPVDERHHRFIAMIDVAKSFVTCKEIRTNSFTALEQLMRTNAYRRFGITIEGTYWRVNEAENQFEHHTAQRANAHEGSGTIGAPASIRQRKHDSATPSAHRPSDASLARNAYQPVSDDEANAFMKALSNGLKPPVVRIGEMDYLSDLAPLDSGIMIGGTQYGKL